MGHGYAAVDALGPDGTNPWSPLDVAPVLSLSGADDRERPRGTRRTRTPRQPPIDDNELSSGALAAGWTGGAKNCKDIYLIALAFSAALP